MNTPTKYLHDSRIGPFELRLHTGRWQVWWRDEYLGPYNTAQQAAEAAAGGTCDWPSAGNSADVGLSDTLEDWRAS